jgi:hypothetical protein
LVAGDRILHQGDVISQLCGVTHRRFNAGIRLLANRNLAPGAPGGRTDIYPALPARPMPGSM